jgi:hypothetical protein
MINAFLFLLHLTFIGFVFYKKYKSESTGDAVLNIILILVIFTVGWSLLAFILKFFVPAKGLGKEFNRDTITLTLLTIGEFFFYRIYYAPLFTSSGKEKQS